MSIVYLVPGNMTGGSYGIKELKRREKLLNEWSFDPSKIKVYDVLFSAYLMLPYLGWLCFAFVLNYSILILN